MRAGPVERGNLRELYGLAGRVLVTASVMLPRYARGNLRGERDPACREGPGSGRKHYPAHVTCSHKASSSRDSPPVGCQVRTEDMVYKLTGDAGGGVNVG